ncbi:MAG: hypothetical protein JW741_21170 [Sedimentisphaerales bacterium]|nr:hypothetical protein [Sedimentisphaerales bacterium]
MLGRISAWTRLVCLTLAFAAPAAAHEDLTAGRARMLEGSTAGFAHAYQIFDAALENENRSHDADDRELVFLHTVTRAVVLFHDYPDVVPAARFLALAEEFGISLAQSTLVDFKTVLSPGSSEDCVSSSPGADTPARRDLVLMELSAVIAELDSIRNTPTPLTVRFAPQETGLAGTVEVDYGEVLILKGLLLACQAELEGQAARHLDGDPETTRWDACLAENFPGVEGTGAATEIDLLRVVDDCVHDALYRESSRPMAERAGPCDEDDGAAVSTPAVARLADAITCFLDAIDYMLSENHPPGVDPQEDEMLYLGPNARGQMAPVQARLRAWRRSLRGSTPAKTVETTWRYDLCDANGDFLGELVLTQDSLGPNGNGGWLAMNDGAVLTIEWMDTGADNTVVMDLHDRTTRRQAWLEATFSAGRDSISNGTMDCWGQSTRIVTGVTGRRIQNSAQPVRLHADEAPDVHSLGPRARRMSDEDQAEPYEADWPGLLDTLLTAGRRECPWAVYRAVVTSLARTHRIAGDDVAIAMRGVTTCTP